MRPFRKATIKDVARRAGVSTTTVSYFVSGRDSVCSPETASRIRAAIDALHYTPSSLTTGLRHRATNTLGVCTTHPFDLDIVFAVPYFERLIRGIMHQADIEKYALLRYHADDRNSDNSDVFLDGRVDGLIFDPLHSHHAPRVIQAGMPTVLVTRSRNLPSGAGGAYADERMTVDLALSHLWSLGHRRIAHIAGPVDCIPDRAVPVPADFPTCPVANKQKDFGFRQRHTPDDIAYSRLENYIQWMQERGVYDPDLIGLGGSWQGLLNPEIVARWHGLPDPPTAVFCANDELAAHLLSLAGEIGWRVPENLSVVGVDNFNTAVSTSPQLTTVDVPVDIVGREGVRILIALIQGLPVEQCRVCVPVTNIVVRASTAPPALS